MKYFFGFLSFIILFGFVGCQREITQSLSNSSDNLTIFSFTPDSAQIGSDVVVKGKGFDTSVNGNVITINNIQQTVLNVTDTTVVIQIATGTTTGQISIVANGQTAISSNNLVIDSLVQSTLSIISFAPDSATIGDTVIIIGSGFGTVISENRVSINNTVAQIIKASDTVLVVKVLAGTTTGKITVEARGQTVSSVDSLVIALGNPWIKKADFPGYWPDISGIDADYAAVTSISVGDKGYFLKGSQLWEYSPLQNIWTRKKDGPIGFYCFAFAINNKIYVGAGDITTLDSVRLSEYDIATNSWTKKKNLPIQPRFASFGFAVNNIGYVGGGQISFDDNINAHDFWKYDVQNDTWSRLADFPGPWTIGISGFVIGTEPFVYDAGLGFPQAPTAGITHGRLWHYNIATNTWEEKASCPGGEGNFSATAFSIGNKGYVALSVTKTPPEPKNDFWMYDPVENAWTKKTDIGGGLRWFGSGFSIGNKGYVGLGTGNIVYDQKKDFWEYTPE